MFIDMFIACISVTISIESATLTMSRYIACLQPWQSGLGAEWCDHSSGVAPFQTAQWIDSWYRSFASSEVEPLLMEVRERQSGAGALALPLIRYRDHGRRVIGFADLGVTDYNAPLLGQRPPGNRRESIAMWSAVKRVLPAADLCIFNRMPEFIGARPNPMVEALGGHGSHLFGNLIETNDDLDQWRASLDGHARGEFRRLWRVFSKFPDARFIRAGDVGEAAPLLAWLEEWQSRRSRELGRSPAEYLLDRPRYAGFYRDLLQKHTNSGQVICTALASGERIAAVSYGVAVNDYYAQLRIAFDPYFFSAGPARLLLERTITVLHGEGYRKFDFTIGDYQHKRKFNVSRVLLRDVTVPLSVRGLMPAGMAQAKALVKSYPGLENLARRVKALARPRPVLSPDAT